MGLSPYTRGNPRPDTVRAFRFGSIPVHTGKPLKRRDTVKTPLVYPRTHGETFAPCQAFFAYLGLSPYTRGNLLGLFPTLPCNGSIPVHTGKPVVGGLRLYYKEGLSPYTRGNLSCLVVVSVSRGSIPVHTGKPSFYARSSHLAKVYPRTHGETCTNVYFFLPRK